jgi:hypothetical protein
MAQACAALCCSIGDQVNCVVKLSESMGADAAGPFGGAVYATTPLGQPVTIISSLLSVPLSHIKETL